MPKLEFSSHFSIIIPHYNDPEGLASCLAGIYQQSGEYSFEVIVIDDCSDTDISDKIRQQYPQVIFKRLNQNGGPGAARNRGVALAKGRYLAFVDSDAVPGPQWLASLAVELDKGAKIICGPVWHGNSVLERLTALTAFGEYLDNENGYRKHCPSVNYAVESSILKKNSYDETIKFAGEDMVLSTKLVTAGYVINYSKDVWVRHAPQLSPAKFSRRAFLYGKGFKESRERCRQLSGYGLHRYLGPLSAFVLFFARVLIDMNRLVKHRKILIRTPRDLIIFPLGILWTRIYYAAGVFLSYFFKNKGNNS